jgi:hypothetical protein
MWLVVGNIQMRVININLNTWSDECVEGIYNQLAAELQQAFDSGEPISEITITGLLNTFGLSEDISPDQPDEEIPATDVAFVAESRAILRCQDLLVALLPRVEGKVTIHDYNIAGHALINDWNLFHKISESSMPLQPSLRLEIACEELNNLIAGYINKTPCRLTLLSLNTPFLSQSGVDFITPRIEDGMLCIKHYGAKPNASPMYGEAYPKMFTTPPKVDGEHKTFYSAGMVM